MNDFAIQHLLAPLIAATLGFLALWMQEWRRHNEMRRIATSGCSSRRYSSLGFSPSGTTSRPVLGYPSQN